MKKLKAKKAIFTENVGIGEENPTNGLLHLKQSTNDAIRLQRSDSGANDGNIYFGHSGGGFGISTSGAIGVTNPDFFISSTGSVGIGTDSPSSNLHVQVGNSQTATLNLNNSDGNGTLSQINLGYTADPDHGNIKYTGNITFSNAGNTERMRIDTNGNVGIGTTNPIGKLAVVGDNADIFLQQSNGTISAQVVSDASGNGKVTANNSVGNPICHLDSNGVSYINGGDVGIGTTGPINDLHIHSATTGVGPILQLSNDTGDCRLFFGTDSTTGSANAAGQIRYNVASDYMSFYSNLNERMRIDSSGDVGIGTTTPANKLHIQQGVLTGGSTNTNTSVTIEDASNTGIQFLSAGQTQLRFGDAANNGAGSILYKHADDQLILNTSSVIALQGGKVGIGTTNPSAKLEIFGSGSSFKFTRDEGDRSAEMVYDGSKFLIKTPSADRFSIADASSNELLTINPNDGNVGIGTTNPNGTLTVRNSNSDTVQLILGNELNSGGRDWRLGRDNVTTGDFIISYSDVSDNNNTTEAMRIDSNGNVGIGTTNAGNYRLNVQNGLQEFVQTVQNNNTTNGYGLYVTMSSNHDNTTSEYIRCATNGSANINFRVYSNGTIFSDGSSLGSDDRIKHNEEKIVNAVETLSKITPKKYFKTTKLYEANHDFDLDSDGNPIDENGDPVNHRVEAGVIAQEVLGVDELKFAVSPETKDEDGNVTTPYALNYNSLFTYAIAAIQEQQAMIEDLKKEIEQLKS